MLRARHRYPAGHDPHPGGDDAVDMYSITPPANDVSASGRYRQQHRLVEVDEHAGHQGEEDAVPGALAERRGAGEPGVADDEDDPDRGGHQQCEPHAVREIGPVQARELRLGAAETTRWSTLFHASAVTNRTAHASAKRAPRTASLPAGPLGAGITAPSRRGGAPVAPRASDRRARG